MCRASVAFSSWASDDEDDDEPPHDLPPPSNAYVQPKPSVEASVPSNAEGKRKPVTPGAGPAAVRFTTALSERSKRSNLEGKKPAVAGSRFSNYKGKLDDVAGDEDSRISRPQHLHHVENRDDELVWNPKTKKYYRHGSCWEESHSVPRADLIEGPGRTRRQDHGRENPERIAPVAHAADFPRRAPQRKPILSSRDGAAATSCRV